MNEPDKKRTSYRVLWLFLLLVSLLAAMRFLLPWAVFKPTAALSLTPAARGIAFEDVILTTSDGVRIHGWYVPAPDARAVLLFFHGNSGNISNRIDSIEIFHDLGLSVFIIDYRGYGRSEGRLSIAGTTLDGLAAWRWLTEEKGAPAENVVVFGRSLGGAIAVDLTRYAEPGALILESTFSSLPDMVRVDFLAPLARLIIGDVWNSVDVVSTLVVPTLCIHSPDDWIVPYRLGKRLYDAVAGEKTFVEIRGGHNEGFMESIAVYRPALDAFLTKRFGESRASR